jgi:1-deoxy-D-xylulose-5-phosphate synthase
MTVMAPKDENELQHMLQTAIEHDGPTIVRYPRGTGYGVPLDQVFSALPIGRGEVIHEGPTVLSLPWNDGPACAISG